MQRRRLGLPLVALALVVGCGSRSGGSATAQRPELTTADFASTLADAQKRAETVHIDARLTAMGERLTMTGDVDGERHDPAFDLTLSGAAMGGAARIILVDRVLYVRIPGLTPAERFFTLDLDHGDHPAARVLDRLLDQVGRLEPSRALKAFAATVDLRRAGTAVIDGVETTRYDVTVDTRKALRVLDLDGLAPSRRLPRTIGYDVWLDREHLMRRMRATVFGATMDATFSRWGGPVDIAAPPAGATTPMPGMARLHERATARG